MRLCEKPEQCDSSQKLMFCGPHILDFFSVVSMAFLGMQGACGMHHPSGAICIPMAAGPWDALDFASQLKHRACLGSPGAEPPGKIIIIIFICIIPIVHIILIIPISLIIPSIPTIPLFSSFPSQVLFYKYCYYSHVIRFI